MEHDLALHTSKVNFTSPLYLDSGRILEPYCLVYETYGVLNENKDNVVVVTHALTGSHHAAGWYEGDKKPGWWDGMIGSGKAIDTDKFFIICVNVLGSCYGSTAPMSPMYPNVFPYRLRFPVLSIRDMVRAQKTLFGALGLERVYAIIGGSMGGMQALMFAIDYPNFAQKIIPLATTYATRPHVIAANKIMSEAIFADSDFNGGNYNLEELQQKGCKGLAIARMLGFMHYLSPTAMQKKFGRNYVQNDGLYELRGRFEVERYLEYNGYNFSKYFDPLSYLYLIKAVSNFDVALGFDSMSQALGRIQSSVHLITFSGDCMFFPSEMEELHKMLCDLDKKSTFYEVQSDYGHDSFLVEIEKIQDYVKSLLED